MGDYRSVKLYGPAVESLQVYEGVPASFFINVADAGAGLIGVEMTSSEGGAVENYEVEERGDGNYLVTFIPPKQNSVITAKVSFAKNNVPGFYNVNFFSEIFYLLLKIFSGSPFSMRVLQPLVVKSGNVNMLGDISKKNLPASIPVRFEINTNGGSDKLDVGVVNSVGRQLTSRVDVSKEGKSVITFTPDELGAYK